MYKLLKEDYLYKIKHTIMKQEIILNEHNKQKHSTMHKRRVYTFVNIRMVIVIVGIFILCSCQNTSEWADLFVVRN